MPEKPVPVARTIEDDASALDEALRRGFKRPLLLWGHPGIGQSALVEMAAQRSGLPFRTIDATVIESWDGFRDVSDSGHFRELTLEKFLARGERADPETFSLESGGVLYLRRLNRLPGRLIQAVFDQVVKEGKLLNNPLPDDTRVVIAAFPAERKLALELLGPALRKAWEALDDHASLKYEVSAVPKRVLEGCDAWSVVPSVARFVEWGRRKRLAEEVLRFLEDESKEDLARATADLHASLIHGSQPFPQMASPRSFADLGSLLADRRLYFSSRRVRDALRRSGSMAEMQAWLHTEITGWDPEHWIEDAAHLTLRGEPVTGSVWLRNLIDQVRRQEAQIPPSELPVYAAYERRSLAMWATQELGDDVGERLVEATAITAADLAHLAP